MSDTPDPAGKQPKKLTLPQRAKRSFVRRVTLFAFVRLPAEVKFPVVAFKGVLEIAERRGYLDPKNDFRTEHPLATKVLLALKEANDKASEYFVVDRKTVDQLINHSLEVRAVRFVIRLIPGGKRMEKLAVKGATRLIAHVLKAAMDHHESRQVNKGQEPPQVG